MKEQLYLSALLHDNRLKKIFAKAGFSLDVPVETQALVVRAHLWQQVPNTMYHQPCRPAPRLFP